MKPKEWIFTIILVLDLVLLIFFLGKNVNGNTVTVTVDGEQVGSYSLLGYSEHPISGYGHFHLLLVISDGQAFVKESNCPDLICQHHAPISKSGEQIICLPGRVVIAISGEEADVDAVIG